MSPLLDHFGLLAPIYDRLIGPPDPQMLRSMLDLPTTGRLLDAGGGTGRATASLRSHVGELIICDFSAGMLRQARGRGLADAVRGRAERLPFPDHSFDRVVVVDALHHFQRQGAAVRDLLRVLRPEGRLVIEEPDIRRFAVKLIALAEKVALMGSHFHAAEQIQAMCLALDTPATIHRAGHSAWIVALKPGV